jgi:hypothetical protein
MRMRVRALWRERDVHGGVLVREVLALHDAHQAKLKGNAIHLEEPHHRSRGLAHAIPQQDELVLVPTRPPPPDASRPPPPIRSSSIDAATRE